MRSWMSFCMLGLYSEGFGKSSLNVYFPHKKQTNKKISEKEYLMAFGKIKFSHLNAP